MPCLRLQGRIATIDVETAESAEIALFCARGLMIAARLAFWRNDAKRHLVRNLRCRAAYRDDCHARATTSRTASANTIQSAFDCTAASHATANSRTAVSRDARERQ